VCDINDADRDTEKVQREAVEKDDHERDLVEVGLGKADLLGEGELFGVDCWPVYHVELVFEVAVLA